MKISFFVLEPIKSLIFFLAFISPLHAFELNFDSDDFVVSTVFNDVGDFSFNIDVDGDIGPGEYNDPMLNAVIYQVTGVLTETTPSGFSAFDLMRDIQSTDFYAQGSSLWFEIAADADLSDGLQVSELVENSNGEVFIFNGREIENGRFHPALLVLRNDETGQIQNSNNIPNLGVGEIAFGAEYVTNLSFSAQNLTLVEAESSGGSSGGGAISLWGLLCLTALYLLRKRRPA